MSKTRRQTLKLVSSRGIEPELNRGKIVHDARGNAVWDWAISQDALASTSTTGLVRTLTPPDLALEEEKSQAVAGWAGDPYNRQTR